MNFLQANNKVSNLSCAESPSPFSNFAKETPMEDSLPQLLKNGSKDMPENDSVKEDEETGSRLEQNLVLFLFNVVLSFVVSFQNIFMVFTNDELIKGYLSMAILACTLVITLVTTRSLCTDAWKVFNLYVLLDNIFLTQVASSFGFIGFLLVIYTGNWFEVVSMVAFPLEMVFFVGNFRVMMLLVKWSKWRVILYKLILLADSALFFEIGAYYLSVNYYYTGGADSTLDGQVKDFVLLYIFGLFAVFVEMYSKICDIDQTNDLKYCYELKEMEEAKKIEKIRRSVMGISNQIDKAKSRFLAEAKRNSRASYLQVEEMRQA
jgi:hypothetical protein